MASRGRIAPREVIVVDAESTESEIELVPPKRSSNPAKSGVKRRREADEDSREAEVGGPSRQPDGQPAPRPRSDDPQVLAKIEWTDDSDDAYERLKTRKRGRGGGGGRGGGRGGRGGAATDPAKTTDAKGKKRAATVDEDDEAAGLAGPSRRAKPARKRRSFANDTDKVGPQANGPNADNDADDDLNIPDYIKQRRRAFDERRALLSDAGLCLPPDYTDIYFSDDDNRRRRSRLPTKPTYVGLLPSTPASLSNASTERPHRPQFDASVRPSRERKDIVLEYSAGVIPACIAQYLRDYQVAGVQFLHRLFVYQRGGILGDDMGLGKTVQVAAFLTAAFGKTGDERDDKRMRKMRRAGEAGSPNQGVARTASKRWYPLVLIVCPGSLIQNWRAELLRWGWWHVDVYHGAAKDDVLQAARAGRLEIMVTTYATYKNHRDRINTVRWDAVVADECHVLKEPTSETTRAMNAVNALCRIGLTGTAIQNRYDELWTLLNWTNPGRFGSIAEWRQTITRPLTIGQSHDATIFQLSLARRTAKKLVQNLLPDFFLRRMKSLIAHQLPRKTDRVVFCPLTARQSAAYANFINSEQVAFLRTVSDSCDCGAGTKRGWCCHRHMPGGGGLTWFSFVFPTIQSLLKLANHLTLLVPSAENMVGAHDTEAGKSGDAVAAPSGAAAAAAERHQRALNVLKTCVPDDWATLYRQRDSLVSLANPELCGKWKVLRKLLRFWHASGDKVLVFSHNVRLLRILQHLFHNTSYSVSYLDGSLSYDERQRVVDDFNSDPAQFVFLISTRAGGVGLNITSANKVVIFDPHWNPAYDLQAQDRAYRIGQVRDVDVFRLVSAGTIEEIVYARQIYKQQQANIGYSASTERRYFRGVQEDSARQGEIFGLNNLFTFHTHHVVLRDIVHQTNIAEAKAGVHLTAIDMERAAADRDMDMLVKIEGAGGGGGGGGTAAQNLLAALDGSQNSPSSSSAATTTITTTTPKPKSDAVQAILASAGVKYTHDNAEVVGSSRVEAQLSRRAEQVMTEDGEAGGESRVKGESSSDDDEPDLDAGYGGGPGAGQRTGIKQENAHGGHQDNETESDPDDAADLSLFLAHTISAFAPSAVAVAVAAASTATAADVLRLRYNPPTDVLRRQFCTMARDAGFASATDFAVVVEGWTPEQRRQCLEGFYRTREARVREQLEAAQETEGEESEESEEGEEGKEEEEQVASLVMIGDDVVERRELVVKAEEMGEGKKMKWEGDRKVAKPALDHARHDSPPRMVKKEEEDDKKAKADTGLPPIPVKREALAVGLHPAIKQEHASTESGPAVLLSSSPVVAPANTDFVLSTLPTLAPRSVVDVIDDSDETDEL